ncbi:MAG: eukaryotic-like serine/threonine-protein kinase [Actinomycetota bacterium]|nr:eukaryotic-like serine/threonine-protein kinase [Actinomycetota bacterium]
MRSGRFVGLLLSVFLLAVVAEPISAATTNVAAAVTIKPSVGPPTTNVTVTGSGFGANEAVSVDFGSRLMVTKTSGANGSFSASFLVPKTALPGPHSVSATGQTSGASGSATFLVRTDWPRFNFDNAGTGYNPHENVLSVGNVSSGLTENWSAVVNTVSSTPIVAGGRVYVAQHGSGGGLRVFDAAGKTKCSGPPKVCTPLWSTTVPGQDGSTPTVAGGMVYAQDGSVLDAFSANGTTNCSGSLNRICQPLWTASLGGNNVSYSSPVVAKGFGGNVVFATNNTGVLYGFSANGTTGCTGSATKTCQPIWSARFSAGASNTTPVVDNGVVYIGSPDKHLYAFDAAGTTNCTGTTTKSCTALWTGAVASAIGCGAAPAVANGIVYIGTCANQLSAFSTSTTSCTSTTTKTCQPLWTATTALITASPVVANGIVYVGRAGISAFSADGTTNCGNIPKTCQPLWKTAPFTGNTVNASPAIANGVLYVAYGNGLLYAYRAASSPSCTAGSPTTCPPIWSASNAIGGATSPVVVDGRLYSTTSEGHLKVFTP